MSEMIQIKTLKKVFVSDKTPQQPWMESIFRLKRGNFRDYRFKRRWKKYAGSLYKLPEKPTSGTVAFDGKDLGSMDKKELRKARQSIGMIFQGFHLLMQRTALRNVCFPLEIAGVSQKRSGEKGKRNAESGRDRR